MANYSLEQVLGLKRQLEDQRKLQLAQAEKARQEQVQRLDALLRTMEDQLDSLVTPDLIEHRGNFLSACLTRIQDARQELITVTDTRDKAQESLVYAALDRKKFEIHKENVLAVMRQAEQVAEQIQLDESATQVFLRQVLR